MVYATLVWTVDADAVFAVELMPPDTSHDNIFLAWACDDVINKVV